MASGTPQVPVGAEELVVLVHGLWCNRRLLQPLAGRLRRCGFRVACFDYPSVRRSPQQNAADLARWLQDRPEPVVHYVAHSLGGFVVGHLFADFAPQPPGRVVLLGTPLAGSRSAARLARLPGGRKLLGASIRHGLLGDTPPWPAQRQVGMVAGTVGVGLGLLLGGLGESGDGAVAVRETYGRGLTDHVQVRTSHTGLLFSPTAARQACAFLRQGRFLH